MQLVVPITFPLPAGATWRRGPRPCPSGGTRMRCLACSSTSSASSSCRAGRTPRGGIGAEGGFQFQFPVPFPFICTSPPCPLCSFCCASYVTTAFLLPDPIVELYGWPLVMFATPMLCVGHFSWQFTNPMILGPASLVFCFYVGVVGKNVICSILCSILHHQNQYVKDGIRQRMPLWMIHSTAEHVLSQTTNYLNSQGKWPRGSPRGCCGWLCEGRAY